MCGRFAASTSASVEEVVEDFEISFMAEDVPRTPRWNVAPTDVIRVVVGRDEGGTLTRGLVGMRWGLVPTWSKGPGTAPLMINARVETVAQKPSFRKPFVARRCLVPADGYYEWMVATAQRRTRTPVFIHPRHGSLAMAGVYDLWRTPDDAWLASVAIITTQATDELGHVHDRMPMVVTDRDAWLDPALDSAEAARALLVAPQDMVGYEVGRAVGNVRNDDASLVLPV